MKNLKILTFGILSVLILAACTEKSTGNFALDSTDSQAEVKEITIEMNNWELKQQGPQINKGDKVRLRVKGVSGVHGITIPDLGIETDPILPGEEKIIEFEATKSGTFDYYCNVYCGDKHMEMRNKIIIQDEGGK